jgi:hypothetical protein
MYYFVYAWEMVHKKRMLLLWSCRRISTYSYYTVCAVVPYILHTHTFVDWFCFKMVELLNMPVSFICLYVIDVRTYLQLINVTVLYIPRNTV